MRTSSTFFAVLLAGRSSDDTTSRLPLKFHMLTRGQPKDSDNLQVYTGESFSDEVFPHPGFECMLQRNR